MQIELIIFIAMVAVFFISTFALHLPVSLGMVLASIVGSIVSGHGIQFRHLVEGMFGYIDTILVIATAMIFMKVFEGSGALQQLNNTILRRFHNKKILLLILLMIIVMFPGMITGSSTAAVLSAGAIVAPVFMKMGISKQKSGAIIAIGAIAGMIAPPVNVPAMIIGGGIDLPYVGFTLPLLLLSLPVAIFTVLFLGLKEAKSFDYDESIRTGELVVEENKYGFKLYIPLIVVLLLMILTKTFPQTIPDLGMSLIFIIGAIIGIFTGDKINIVNTSKAAIKDVLPVMGILMGVGMFIQIMTFTGVRGLIVNAALSMPSSLLYLSIALMLPAFGAVSSFGSASVLGVPFVLALIGQNEIVTAAALSLIAGLGDLVPPTALAGIFAAQVVKEENYAKVLKYCRIPALVILAWGLVFVIFAKPIASMIF
ncbi:MAG: TRAP transporter large permease subunit [Tissierellia bacterium]|nr:TRAP transporter large permease subunit [Tissierellia bacterium]